MANALRLRILVLFLGDVFFLCFALWVSLLLRSFTIPGQGIFITHLIPFSLIFAVSLSIFFIAGLYESRSVILARRAFSVTLLVAQIINVLFAALLFFFVPPLGITPKTILVIYLAVSFFFVLLWRVYIFPWFGIQKTERAMVVGESKEIKELVDAIEHANRAPARVVEMINPGVGSLALEIEASIHKHNANFVIADFSDPRVSSAFPALYNFLSSGIRFFDALPLYEQVFGRIPLSILNERWLAKNISRYSHTLYDQIKRVSDILIAGIGAIISLIFYPFIALAIKLEDGGPIFIAQERVGQDNAPIRIYKFRSMQRNEVDVTAASDNKVTHVGKFLRVIRLDELPQLWSVVLGDLSLIGPRPELPSGVALYEKEIPYYGMRHLIKPGLSGWAAINQNNDPHHVAHVEATREKLSYDLYYLKHRSFMLDSVITLKTFKKLLTRSGV